GVTSTFPPIVVPTGPTHGDGTKVDPARFPPKRAASSRSVATGKCSACAIRGEPGGHRPPDPPNQRIKSSNRQMVDHEPPRTARTWLLKSLRLTMSTCSLVKSTPHASSGPPARVVDDQ